MTGSGENNLLRQTAELAIAYIEGIDDRPVGQPPDLAALRAGMSGPLPERGIDAAQVIEDLARDADPGIVATAGSRYFGFVTGGSLPAALAADWLTSAWDAPASLYVSAPALAVVEEVAADWLIDLFGLPPRADGTGVGFTTGCTMANFTALAAGRHAVLRDAGWDVEAQGLYGAPEIQVVVGEEAHATISAALQMLGLGRERVTKVPADGQGRMRADVLAAVLSDGNGPAIVCAQSGNVNTGAFDPMAPIAEACRARGAWLHVDGAFGLWAAASPDLRYLVDGVAQAQSWATDAHKWLNVPYDSGLVLVADGAAQRAAMSLSAAYIQAGPEAVRDPLDWVPEFSRRGRGFTVYAALRSLGRRGLAELIDRCCALTRRMAARLEHEPGVEVLNDVVLNQALVRFGDDDELTRAVVDRVQRDGTCWLGGTTWHGKAAMRVSVSGWRTTETDIDRSAEAILRCARAVRDY